MGEKVIIQQSSSCVGFNKTKGLFFLNDGSDFFGQNRLIN